MNISGIILGLSLSIFTTGFCTAGVTDTASAPAPRLKVDSVAKVAAAPKVKYDTAVVQTYNGMPVFYHCKPLHPYKRLGYMTRTSLVSYLSQMFDKYTRAARKKNQGHLGIIIDNLNFGTDSFDIVRFSAADGRADTAVFTDHIFLSARPTKPYKVIRIIKDNFGAGSLNASLQGYFKDAQSLHVPFDGIMLRDINYAFSKDNIFVFRWKK